jgi:hypothetical protein
MSSVWTELGDLSSGGRFHERAAQYLQGVGPNVISRFNTGLSVFLKQYKTRQITWRLRVGILFPLLFDNLAFTFQPYRILFK